MPLEIILGKPTDNISDIVFDKLLAAAADGCKAILIVPDQAEFETERRLYSRCKRNNTTNLFSSVEITTISKLCDAILETYSKGNAPADDITKSILMYCAIRESRDDLTAFKGIAEKPGFAGRMISTVSMLKAAGFKPYDEYNDDAKAMSEKLNSVDQVLSAKFSDINRIYLRYDTLLSERYSDRLDSAAKAAKLAKDNRYFKDKEVFLQDFDTFSASQRNFIDTIITSARKTTMAYITELGEDVRGMFQPVNSEISHFSDIADGAEITAVNSDDSGCDPNISGISRLIFGNTPVNPELPPSDSVTLVSAGNVYSELDYVAAEIKRLCTEEGYSYNQIALLTPQASDYKTSIESAFEKYEIPFFCDIPDSMRHMPLTNLVLSLINVIRSFTVDDLLNYIKTGFVRIDDKLLNDYDINHFEEFIFKWKLRPEDLKQPFPESNSPHDSTANAERIRKGLADSITALQDKLKDCDGATVTKVICEFILDDLKLNSSITRQCMYIGESDSALKDQLISSYQMQWNVLRHIFESMFTNLAGIKLSLKEYYQLFRDICSSTPLAKPPQVLDAVIAGDISRTKAYDIRAAFIVGTNFENFPAESKQSGIFSDYELKLLMQSTELPLTKTEMDSYLYSQYQAYRALALPCDKLYICHSALDIASNDAAESEVFQSIRRIYSVREEQASGKSIDFYCRSMKAAQQRYAATYLSDPQHNADIRLAMKLADGSYDESSPNELSTDYTKALDKAADTRTNKLLHSLTPQTAELIYRSDIISATKLEKLAECPFNYFCENGLKINTVTAKEVNPLEIGNAVHHALCTILQDSFTTDEAYDRFINSTDSAIEKDARAALDNYKEKQMLGSFAKSNSFNYQYDNISIAVSDMLKLFREEFRHSKYRPKLYELTINKDTSGQTSNGITSAPLAIQLDNGRTIYVTGNVDRVDVLDDGEAQYLRVIDYKTGKKDFNGAEVKYGLNTQMLNYLMALSNANKQLKDGGISYIPSGVTGADSKTDETFNNRLVTGHAPIGVYVKYGDNSVTETDIDNYIAGMTTSFDLTDKAKIIDKDEAIISAAQFDTLKTYCMESNKAVLTDMYNGKINAIPTTHSGKLPCEYCNFRDICGNNGNNYNMVEVASTSSKKSAKSDGTKKADNKAKTTDANKKGD